MGLYSLLQICNLLMDYCRTDLQLILETHMLPTRSNKELSSQKYVKMINAIIKSCMIQRMNRRLYYIVKFFFERERLYCHI